MVTTGHPSYRPDIDGLRAIAVASVVIFHAAPGRLPSGFIGVDVFFVISGFLITSIILGRLGRGQFSFIEFYIRRINRIFPALCLVLASCLFAAFLVMTDDEAAGLGKNVAAGAGFVANLSLWSEIGYFDIAADVKPLLHLWSLGIEEQFYLFWPLALYLVHGRRAGYLVMVVVIGFVSFALNIYQVHSDPSGAFYSPLARFWELLLGGALAYPTHYQPSALTRQISSSVGSILMLIGFVAIGRDSIFPGWWVLLPTCGTALLIWAGPSSWVNRAVLSRHALVGLGLISFPLYLWHWPLLSFPRLLHGQETPQWTRLVSVAVAIPLAWLTYQFLEKPIRRSRNPGRMSIALILFMTIIGASGLWVYAQNGFAHRPWAPKVVNVGDTGSNEFFAYVGKHYTPCTPAALRKQAEDGSGFLRCPQSKTLGIKNIAVIGDSHAESLFPGLAEAMPDKNIVFYGNGGGLPFLENPDYTNIFNVVLADQHIKKVLIAAVWGRKLTALPMAQWHQALEKTVMRLIRAEKEVYLVDDVPTFPFFPTRCKYDERLGVANQCRGADTYPETAYLPVFEKIAAANGAAHVINVHKLFCNGEICSMAQGGILLFRDENHLTISGSRVAGRAIAPHLK